MQVKVKRLHPDAAIPTYAEPGSAGLDLTAISCGVTDDFMEYDTGLAFEIPKGYVGLLFPRSSISKTGHSLANAVGVIDSSYRGPVKLRMRYKEGKKHYIVGEKVGQLVIIPYPQIELLEVDALNHSARGFGGFGSTGA